MSRQLILASVAATFLFASISKVVVACPFCSAVSQTFGEEIVSTDVVVIARIVQLPAPVSDTSDDVPRAKFEIVDSIKGGKLVAGKKIVETIYFGEAVVGDKFLIMGVDPPKVNWSTPLKINDRSADYIRQVVKLPKDGVERLEFFQKYLEDKDEILARDAYDEFAKAPYDMIAELKKSMDHDQLVTWIKDPNVPASRRRLYLVMLSVCGTDADIAMLEEMLGSDDRKTKSGLDAMIGCYLTLRGADGMPLIEELFLKNKKAEYADTYAAIMALRFHGSETDIIPKKRILEGLAYMLERPQLADLVIPDLARWEDWSRMERLVQLFKEADAKTSWVRVPVINYLRACPKPEAKKYISELEKIDPDAVRRANTFFPFGGSGGAPTEKSSAVDRSEFSQPVGLDHPTPASLATGLAAVGWKPAANSAASEFDNDSNLLTPLGVMLMSGFLMLLAQWRILSGGSRIHV